MTERDAKAAVREYLDMLGKPIGSDHAYTKFYNATHAWANSPDGPDALAELAPTTTMQEDIYSIPEGRIVVQWPAALSAESIEEVKEYLKLLERKITRSLTKEASG